MRSLTKASRGLFDGSIAVRLICNEEEERKSKIKNRKRKTEEWKMRERNMGRTPVAPAVTRVRRMVGKIEWGNS